MTSEPYDGRDPRPVPLTAEERFALAESVSSTIDAVRDLLRVAHRTSAQRHRAARMAVAVAHVLDAVDAGALDVSAPHVREWLAREREACAEYATEQAQWLRELRDREPDALEGLSLGDIPRCERELSATADAALAQLVTCERLLALRETGGDHAA